MKKCPQCGREYDNSMSFCLDDGAELLYGPGAPVDEPATAVFGVSPSGSPATAILHSTASPDEAPTRAQIHTTEQSAVLPSNTANSILKPAWLDKRVLAGAVVLVVITLGGFVAYKYFSSTRQIDSIAVLPLANAGGDPSTEYLTDGVTESLINSLSRVPGLRVVPRSTVFRLKGELTDPAELGQRLGVQAVLTGRVVQRGDRLEVQAELIDISHNAQMWGERYSRKVTDVQDVQREIANAVARKLSAEGRREQQLSSTYTAKSDAYEEYLRGRYAAANGSLTQAQGSIVALGHFRRAVELDPNFAAAHAGVADAYTQLSSATMPPSEAMPKAKDAVLKALAIDPTLADAHRSLAQIYWWGDWNFSGADAEFRRAIELDPSDPRTYIIHGNFLARFNRAEEAEAAAKRAIELDPTATSSTVGLCRVYLYSRRFDDLLPVAEKLVAEAPDNSDSYYFRGIAYLQKGRYDEALSDLQRADARSDYLLAALGYTYAVMGRREDALQVISQMRSQAAQNKFVSPYEIARIYAGLRDKDAAFANLEKAFELRDDNLTRLKIDFCMDNIRSDPRFSDLMKRVGLP